MTWEQMRAEIETEIGRQGLSLYALDRRMGNPNLTNQALYLRKNAPRVDTVMRIAEALGLEIIIRKRGAAE